MRLSGTLNYTNRRKISRSEVTIELDRNNPLEPTFDATFHFNEPITPSARLFVEAYCGDTSQRFDFGTAGLPTPPLDRSLNQIDHKGSIRFRVKVVNHSDYVGRLIATVERFKPTELGEGQNRESLMYMKTSDLGQQVWSMEFSEDDVPILLLNRTIPEIMSRVKEDPLLNSIIIPQAFRLVLQFLVSTVDNDEIEEGGWQERWLEFLSRFSEPYIPDVQDPAESSAWIDRAVDEFCNYFKFRDLLVSDLGEDE